MRYIFQYTTTSIYGCGIRTWAVWAHRWYDGTKPSALRQKKIVAFTKIDQ